MASEIKKELQLEIGHVLFMDIVDYSTRLIDEQRALRDTLNQIVIRVSKNSRRRMRRKTQNRNRDQEGSRSAVH
jgi:hypothetical protein